jgi:O-antigen ligase
MKKCFVETKHTVAMIVCIIWIILFSISLFPGFTVLAVFVVAVAPVLILAWYFFFDPGIFLFLTVFFVPLSVKVDLSGGSFVTFPSEVMAVMLAGYLILNISTFRVPGKRILSHPVFLLLLVYLLWLVITSALGEIPGVSFKRTFIQALFFIVFYFLFLTRFDRPVNIVMFYIFYALGLVVPIINGMVWHSQYNFNPQASYYMPQPFFIEHTVYGATIAFVIPMLIYLVFFKNGFVLTRVRRWRLAVLLLICLTGEFLSFSRGAWLSLMVLPFFILVLKLKLPQMVLFAGLLVLLVLFLLNLDAVLKLVSHNEAQSNRGNLKEQIESVTNIHSDISNLERINRWECAIRMFESRPVTGYGVGTYQFVYGRFQVKDEMTRISTYHGEKGNAHSEYLGFLAETGLPGLIIYICLLFSVISTATSIIYRIRDCMIRDLAFVVLLSLLTFYFHTIFNGFIETDKVGSLFYGSLAAITALDIYYYRRETG